MTTAITPKSGRRAKAVTAKRRGYVLDAATRQLPPCPKCGAGKGDPCRTPLLRTTAPHAGRFLEPLWAVFLRGREIRNLKPEIDCYDPEDVALYGHLDSGNTFSDGSSTFERITPPGTRGLIVDVDVEAAQKGEAGIHVVFPETGAWIILTREETHSEDYELGDIVPEDERQALLREED